MVVAGLSLQPQSCAYLPGVRQSSHLSSTLSLASPATSLVLSQRVAEVSLVLSQALSEVSLVFSQMLVGSAGRIAGVAVARVVAVFIGAGAAMALETGVSVRLVGTALPLATTIRFLAVVALAVVVFFAAVAFLATAFFTGLAAFLVAVAVFLMGFVTFLATVFLAVVAAFLTGLVTLFLAAVGFLVVTVRTSRVVAASAYARGAVAGQANSRSDRDATIGRMELRPVPPPPGFREAMAVTYDGVAQQRQEMGEAEWRWPIAERFLDLMRHRGFDTLLEIGAGVGFTSRWFADQGIDVTATDLSPAQVELCLAKGLKAFVRDMYDPGYPAGSFGAVWMMNCIHHIPSTDVAMVLAGIADVLHPDGLLYLGVWGGVDREGMPVADFYLPPRYFCFRSDETLLRVVGEEFEVISFETFSPESKDPDDDLHMQSLFLQRRR